MAVHKAKPLSGISLNYEVVGGTTAPTTFNKENTIWVNTSTAIGEHRFSYAPNQKTVTVTESFTGAGGSAKYWTTASGTSSASDWSTDYITVKPDKEYTITKNQATTNISISFWTSSNEFIKYQETKVSSVTFTTPSNCTKLKVWTAVQPQSAFDALDWKLIYSSIVYLREDGSNLQTGDVWIRTDIDKAPVSFNAIKKDELMIYPYMCKQWNGSSWKRMAGALYKNGTSVLDYKSIYQPTIDSSNFTIMSAGHFPAYNFNSNTFYARSEWYNGGSSEYCVIRSNNIIDLSEYSKISFTVYHSNSTGGGDYNYVICQTYLDANRSTLVSNDYWQQNSNTVNTSTTYTVDVSDRTDKIYLYIGVEQTHSNWNFTFSNIVLE